MSALLPQATQSFGVRPPPNLVTPGGDNSLEQLPVEVLVKVLSYLDSWGLASVALVSHLMRGVAASLLDMRCSFLLLSPPFTSFHLLPPPSTSFHFVRGCVALQWERREGAAGWEVAYKRWFFSSYFQPVERWGMHG